MRKGTAMAMNQTTSPLPLSRVRITDSFWQREIDLVRDTVIPYQWDALNDRIPGAVPGWWMHNMRAAARAVAARKDDSSAPSRPQPDRIVVEGPDPADADPDAFYGWVFQDSDGYKWLEAVSGQLALRPDADLQARAQQAVDAIAAAQEEDGYLDTYYTLLGREYAFTNLKDHHELYCFGHLVEAAVAWREATGQEDLLNVARRFAACIRRRFAPGKERGCPGHEIAEMALFRLYEATGEQEWLELANFFLDVRGTEPSTFALEENVRRRAKNQPELPVTAERYSYYQAHLPVRRQREATGHAVRQMYLCSGMADAARLNRDPEMREACLRLWESVTREKMYVTGGVGATHVGEAFSRPYDLPSDTAYSETCAAIGLVFFARRMLQLEPKSEYADVMERALYNTVLAGMALDGKSFFYVNPLEVDPQACETDQRLEHVKHVRQKWYSCACCPPNVSRLLSSLGAYIFTRAGDTLYTHLYIRSETDAELNGQPLRLRMDADLFRDGEVRVTVLSGEAEGTLAFRRPEWTDGFTWDAPGKSFREGEDGYLYFTGTWKEGDTVSLDFSMPVRVLRGNPLIRETRHQLCYARGPLVFCAEEADNGPLLHLIRALPQEKAALSRKEIGGVTLPVLTVPARRVQAPDAPLYTPWQKDGETDCTLTLIPCFAWCNRRPGEMRVWLYD